MLYYANQNFSTTLNVAGGIDASQTTGIILQDVSGLDTSKPGIAAITWADPLDTSKVEYITFSSISANTLQGVTRGTEGFSAKTHDNGATVVFPISESHINNLNDQLATRSIGIQIAAGDSDIATGDGQGYFTIPAEFNGLNLSAIHARVITAGTTGTTDIQIHNVTDAVDMLSTVLTVDSGETGSDTAATAAVIDTSNDDVATNDLLRIDIDAVSTTAPQGLIIRLTFS